MFKIESRYDKVENIAYSKMIGKPESEKDVYDNYLNVVNAEDSGCDFRTWAINDITYMEITAPRLVSLYHELILPYSKANVYDFAIVCSNTFQRIITHLFNVLNRNKRPIFETVEGARVWILKRQEQVGRFPKKSETDFQG